MKSIIEKTIAALMLVCAASSAWATGPTLLNYMNFDTVANSAITLQKDAGTIDPTKFDGATINTGSSSKFGPYSYKANDGVVGLQNTTDGLVSVANGFTISFWFHPNTTSDWRSFFGFGFCNGKNYRFDKEGSTTFTIYESAGSGNSETAGTSKGSASFTASAWNHVAIVCQPGGSSVTIYVNGSATNLSLSDISSTSLSEVRLCYGRCIDGTDGAIYRSNYGKQATYFDDFALFEGALNWPAISMIAAGKSTISDLVARGLDVSLEEFGGFVTTESQLAFKNVSLSEITAESLSARIAGAWSGGVKASPVVCCNFDASDASMVICEAQVQDGANVKGVQLTFTAYGNDVYVAASNIGYTAGTVGEVTVAGKNDGTHVPVVVTTRDGAGGYGIYNLRLPRTHESDATVVWNAGELLMPKIGTDGNEYVITLPASGMSVDASGNLKVASSGATTGATIDIASADTQKAGVLMKYSSLAAVADGVSLATAQAVYKEAGDLVVVGVRTTGSNEYTLKGYWEISNNSGSNYPFTSPPSLNEGSGYLHFYYNDNTDNSINGTFGYAGTSISNLAGDRRSDLKWTNADYRIKKVSVGGPVTCANSGVKAWPNVAIEKVALFVGDKYTATDISGFSFSTEATITAAGTYTLAGDNPLFASVSSDESYLINVRESATLNIPAATSVNKITFNVAEGKTLTLTGYTLTATGGINIIGKGKVATAVTAQLSGTIKGDGTLEYDMNNGTTLPSGLTCNNAAWEGTFSLKNSNSGSNVAWTFNNWGSDNSVVRLENVHGYIPSNETMKPTLELVGDGLTIRDANSNTIETIKKLTGSGTLKINKGSQNDPGNGIVIQDATEFRGTISYGVTGRYQVTIGDSGSAAKTAKIIVSSGKTAVIANGKTWLAGGDFEISGILKLVGSGTASCNAGTTSMTTYSGSTLDFSEADSGARITGALTLASGTTVKLPAGATLPYRIATAGDGGLIDNVTVQIGEGMPVTGTVALRNGAITTLASVVIDTKKTYTVAETLGTPSATSSYEINVTADATLNLGADTTVDVVKFNIAAGKTLTISGSKITANSIYVYGEGKVSVSSATALSGTIKGDGRIVYTGTLPDSTLTASLQDGASWTGTVEIKDFMQPTGTAVGIINLGNYGNIQSAVALNKVTSTMFANTDRSSGNYPDVTLKEIEIGEDGWTDHANGPFSCDMSYTAKLTGHGPITVKTSGAGTIKFIGDHTFGGSVTMDANTEKQVAFMKNADDTLPSVTARSIAVASGASMTIASGKSWTAPGGVMIYGALKAEGSSPISHGVTLFETGTLDISGFTGEAPAIPGAFTLNGGVIKLPADAELPYRIAASGDGAPSSCTIGDTTRLDLLLKDGALVTTRTATISTESAEITFGSIAWSGTGNDYTLTLQGGATYLTFDNTTVDYLKIIVQNNGALYIKGDMPENTTIIGLTPLTIVADATETFKAGYTRLYSQIGTTENGNGALNVGGAISVTSADAIPAGSYTLARWLKPQKLSTGYGSVGTLTANTDTLSKELVYCADSIVLRVWNETEQSAKPTLKIWPYGDSITEGFNMGGTKANYRVLLAQKLSLLGYNVEMVGTTDKIQTQNNVTTAFAPSIDPSGKEAPPAWQWHSAKHGGTAGPTSAYERSNEMENVDTLCVQVGNPDAVLLLIGVNDLAASGQTAESTFGSWTNVINRLVENLPNSKIIASTHLYGNVANPTRAGQAPSITAFNNLVRPYMANMPAAWENHVIFLDLNELVGSYADKAADDGVIYNNPTGTADWLHPDWWGHDQMAEGWLSKIVELYPNTNGPFPSATVPSAPTAEERGAAAKSELAAYRRGFRLCRRIDVASNLNTADPYAATGNGETEGIQKVGYFVEYVRADNNAHKWVWVDMDAFGTTLADIGLPTNATHQQVVSSLHVKSNHNGIEDVAANDDTVTGFIEFSPYDYTGTVSGLTGAPTGNGSSYDWNDTLSDSGTMACMQVHRISPSTGRGGQVLFAYNNWRSSTTTAEFGIGNFSQHFHGSGTQTFDYTETKGLEKMNANAYSVKRIEIWTKAVYTAEMSGNSNFSALTFSPTLPGDISECDLVVNVTDDATLTFDSAKTVGSIKFNIAENKTLTLASTSNLTVGKVTLNGPGRLQLPSNSTFGWMDVVSSATLGFANGVSLDITGNLWVASGATLTLEPAAISTASSTIISAASISGNVSVTLPSEAGVDYSTLATDTSYKIVRTPNVAFSYDGTIDATPTGWVSSWAGEGFGAYLRVGPNSTMPVVYEVRDGKHPYADTVVWTDKDITFSIYADISQVSESGRQILVGVGRTGEVDNRKFLILYREGASVKFGVWDTGKYNDDGDPTHLVGTAATVTAPVSGGYHLYTATFNHATGDVGLYLDNSAAATGSAGGAIAIEQGLQIGSILRGVNHDDWSRCSGDHGLTKGIGMAFAAIRGYNAVLAADNVAKLAESFPATDGSLDRTVHMNQSGNTLAIYSSTMAAASGYSLGISQGTLTIPSEETVSVPSFLVSQNDSTTDSATININGTLNINSTSVQRDVMGDNSGRLGVVVGYWKGGSTWNIPTGGRLLGENAYVEFPYSSSSGVHVLNVNGGEVKIKGFFPNSNWTNKGTINLTEGGTIDVSAVEDASDRVIISNFGYGTYRQRCTATVYSTLNFSGTQAQPTTLDPYGYTMTLSSMSGSGYITVADSSDGNGKVVFNGSTTTFGGYIILTDANAGNIDLSGYTGKVLLRGTAAAVAALDGFAGTVKIDQAGTYDASAIDLSAANVQIENAGATLSAIAGKEGNVTVFAGACRLMVDNDTFLWDGHVFSGGVNTAGGATLTYVHSEAGSVGGVDYAVNDEFTSAQLSVVLADNNIVPYYKVFSGIADGDNMAGTLGTKAHWGNLPEESEVPTTGNVAFRVESGKTLTVTIDNSPTFGEVQIIGSGTVVFVGTGTMTISSGLYITSAATNEISTAVAFSSAGIHIQDGGKAILNVGGTSESPYAAPYVGGYGELEVPSGVFASFSQLRNGRLTVNGTANVSDTSAHLSNALTVGATGTVNVGAGVSFYVPTLTVNGTVNMPSTSSFTNLSGVAGTGSINWNGKMPDTTLWSTQSAWCGTNVVSSLSDDENRKIQNWGRYSNDSSQSFIKLIDVRGWTDANVVINPEVILENGSAGYGLEISNGSTTDNPTYFAKLSGSGTLKQTGSGGNQRYVLRDVSDFTGSIDKTDTVRVLIIDATTTQGNLPDKSNQGHMFVANITAKIGDGNGWSVSSGKNLDIAGTATVEMLGSASMSGPVTFHDGATLKFDNIGTSVSPKKLTLSSTPTFASGTVNIAFGNGAALYDGATLIDWTANGSAPAGTFAFSNASLADDWVLLKKADGLYVYSAKIEDSSEEEAGTVEVVDNELVATVEPTGTAVTVNPAVTKLTVSVTANAIANITAAGVAIGNVEVKYGATVTTGAYTITKVGNVISFTLNGEGSVTISGEPITVVPEARGSTAISFVGDTPQFAVKAIPGLWYRTQAYTTSACNDVEPGLGEAVQAEATTVTPVAPPFSGTVKYYKIRVAPSSNGF